ncbi:hypothetical protein Tco_0311795 [Tanacetum coccineum]
MEGWKHKDLKSKDFDSIKELFDKAFKRVNMFVDFRTDLVEAELQSSMEVIPDEEDVAIDGVPLATKPSTIVDWKIHKEGKKSYYQIVRADGKSQMYRVFSLMLKFFSREDLEDLYKLVGRIVGIKSLLNAVSITAALIDVNAAQSKLVLLENFNENYSKCLRLLYKVNAAEGVNAASEEVSTAELVSTAYDFTSNGDLVKPLEALPRVTWPGSTKLRQSKGKDRFNTIITSLKAPDESFSSHNHVTKFLRALPSKWRPKVTAIEESKILSSSYLDELLANLKSLWSKAYVVLNKETMNVEESLNVKFDETPPPSSPPLVDDDLLEVDNH